MKKGHLVGSFALGGVLAVFLWTAGAHSRTTPGTDYRELDRLAEVLQLVRQSYVKEVDDKELIEGALRGMLSTLDPHTERRQSSVNSSTYSVPATMARSSFEGLNTGTGRADTSTGDPVRGLRAIRVFRCRILNVPKPRTSMFFCC